MNRLETPAVNVNTALSRPSQDKVFRKADSLVALHGVNTDTSDVIARVQRLSDRLDGLGLDDYRRSILDRACGSLLGSGKAHGLRFDLQPHVVEELRRVSDEELPRYLFYRYRYDVFPQAREIDAFPPCVQIEPTSICNYRCVFCYQTDRDFTQGRHGHMGMMSLDTFKRAIDQIEGEVEAVTLASRGEPLMCRDIEKMLDYAAGKFLGFKINTNAWYLDEAKAHALLRAEPNTLVFSADAADAELYSQLRVNGRLDRILDNIKQFKEIRERHYPKSRTITRVSGVRFTAAQDFGAIESFWRDHVDQVAFVDYNPWENAYLTPPNDIKTPCSDLWRRTFVWWDGKVNPCDVDYKSTLAAGSILENSLPEIWAGEAYAKLRRDHIEGRRRHLTPCQGCVVV